MCLSLYTIESDASILQVMWVQHMVSTERQEPQSAQPHREPGLRFHVEKSLHFASGGALLRVALELPRGQWLAVLGPSGAGKTSLLRMLAGLAQPDLAGFSSKDSHWHERWQLNPGCCCWMNLCPHLTRICAVRCRNCCWTTSRDARSPPRWTSTTRYLPVTLSGPLSCRLFWAGSRLFCLLCCGTMPVL